MAQFVFILIEIFRIISPLLIFVNPYAATIISNFLDLIDSDFAFYSKMVTWKEYYLLDKILDYWWYIFILLYSINKNIFAFTFALLILRGFGQLLTISKKNEKFLFYFPNIIEPYFIVYLIDKNLFNSYTNSILIIFILIPLVLIREYLIHIKNPLIIKPGSYRKWKNKTRFKHY